MTAASLPLHIKILVPWVVLACLGCTAVTPEAKTQAPTATPAAAPAAAPPAAPPAAAPPRLEPPSVAELPPLPAKTVLDGTVLKFVPGGGWRLTPAGKDEIHRLASLAKSLGPGVKLVLTGYSSATGTKAQNLAVSRHRAEFVAKALAAEGVSMDLISVQGLGADDSVASNATQEGRLKNQRVEVAFQRAEPAGP